MCSEGVYPKQLLPGVHVLAALAAYTNARHETQSEQVERMGSAFSSIPILAHFLTPVHLISLESNQGKAATKPSPLHTHG